MADTSFLRFFRQAAPYIHAHRNRTMVIAFNGDINLPLDRLGADCAQVLPNKATPLVLCCLSGARSGMAAQWLRQQGYQQVANGGSVGSVALQLQRPIRRG